MLSVMARKKKRKRGGQPRSIGDILDGAYPGSAEDRPLLTTFGWWDRTVPPRVSKNARPVSLRRGTLIVHTRTSAWAQELSFHEHDLLRSVQARVPSIVRVRIRVGPIDTVAPTQPRPKPPKVQPLAVGQLPSDVARALAHLGDDRLREAVTKAACAALAPTSRPNKRQHRG
jgi:hypothetical protein